MVVEANIVDISRIESKLIKENYVFGLGFPQTSGDTQWVILRAIGVGKLNPWLYDPIAEGMLTGPIPASTSTDGITNHGFVLPQRPTSNKITNQGLRSFIFQVPPASSNYGYLYQLFFGISPYSLRVIVNEPESTYQMGLPDGNINSSYNNYGAIRADDTPLYAPGPESEVIVPPGLDFALGFVNDVNRPAYPLIMWYINYIRYRIETDADLIYEVINTTKYKSLKTVGGVIGYGYDTKSYFGVNPVTLGMTKSQIQNAVGGV